VVAFTLSGAATSFISPLVLPRHAHTHYPSHSACETKVSSTIGIEVESTKVDSGIVNANKAEHLVHTKVS
jgi:hypothetical protein